MSRFEPSSFPNAVWDGLYNTFNSLETDKQLNVDGKDRVTKEIQAIEQYLVAHATTLDFFDHTTPARALVTVDDTQTGLKYRTLANGANVQITYANDTIVIAATGGGNGSAFTWQGAWDVNTAYVENDVVEDAGSSFINILAANGVPTSNTTYWNLMAQKGADGANGANLVETDPVFIASEAVNVGVADVDFGAFNAKNLADPIDGADAVTLDYLVAAINEVAYTPTSLTQVVGNELAGTVAGVQTLSDGSVYHIGEVSGSPGYDVRFNFTGIGEFNRIWIHINYRGLGSAHIVNIDLWNYNTLAFDTITTTSQSADFKFIDFPVVDTNYIDGSGNAIMRFYHVSSGTTSHEVDFDYVALVKAGMGMASDHGALTGLQDKDHGAAAIFTSTTNFNGILTTNETDVQLALDKLDDHTHDSLYTPLAHKTTEDAINGLIKCDGAGTYSSVTDNSSNWNTAYSWGDHATAGYLVGGLISANTSFFITTTGSDANGDGSIGNPWASIDKALTYLADYKIAPSIIVKLILGAGQFATSVTIEHPQGSQIQIEGISPLVLASTSLQSVSGAAGAWYPIINVNSVVSVSVNDYIVIPRDIARGSPDTIRAHALAGVHKITNVDSVNNRLTFLCRYRSAAFPTTTGQAFTAGTDTRIILTRLYDATNAILSINNKNTLGYIDKLVIEGGDNVANTGNIGLALNTGGSINTGAYFGVAYCYFGVQLQNSSSLSGSYLRSCNNASSGISCLSNSILNAQYCVCNGNAFQGLNCIAASAFGTYSVYCGNQFGLGCSVNGGLAADRSKVNENTSHGLYVSSAGSCTMTYGEVRYNGTGSASLTGSYVDLSSTYVTNNTGTGIYTIIQAAQASTSGGFVASNGTDLSPVANTVGNWNAINYVQ
jgi:hypothetical protein